MGLLFAVLLLATLICATRAVEESPVTGMCPFALGKYPYDADRFLGEWYILSGTPLFFRQFQHCPRFTVSARRSKEGLYYRSVLTAVSPRDNTLLTWYGAGQAYNEAMGSLYLSAFRDSTYYSEQGNEQWSDVIMSSIVATDYDNFAVFVGCRHVFNTTSYHFERRLGAQVWARRTSLPKSALYVLENILTSYDIREEEITRAEHTNCNYGSGGYGPRTESSGSENFGSKE